MANILSAITKAILYVTMLDEFVHRVKTGLTKLVEILKG